MTHKQETPSLITGSTSRNEAADQIHLRKGKYTNRGYTQCDCQQWMNGMPGRRRRKSCLTVLAMVFFLNSNPSQHWRHSIYVLSFLIITTGHQPGKETTSFDFPHSLHGHTDTPLGNSMLVYVLLLLSINRLTRVPLHFYWEIHTTALFLLCILLTIIIITMNENLL